MSTGEFKNAAKYYKELKHQDEAWEFLQSAVHPEIVEEFFEIYRNQKTNYLVDLPKSGVELIKEFEGCHLKSYYDPLSGGLPITIGWGSTKRLNGFPFHIGNTITQEEADELLYKSLKKDYLPQLTKIPYWDEMNDNQRGALLSFAYNLGANFYNNPGFSTISRVLRNKQWDKVPDTLFLYRNPGSKVEKGLARRRNAEGILWKFNHQ